jgi:hypothetical protein
MEKCLFIFYVSLVVFFVWFYFRRSLLRLLFIGLYHYINFGIWQGEGRIYTISRKLFLSPVLSFIEWYNNEDDSYRNDV